VSGIRPDIDQRASSAKLAIHVVPRNRATHGYIGSCDMAAARMSSDVVATRPGQGDIGAAGVCTRLDQGRGGLRDADAARINLGIDAAGYFQGFDAAGIGTCVYRTIHAAHVDASRIGGCPDLAIDLAGVDTSGVGLALDRTFDAADVDTAGIGARPQTNCRVGPQPPSAWKCP
jgi:hypothetical protein